MQSDLCAIVVVGGTIRDCDEEAVGVSMRFDEKVAERLARRIG